MNGATTFTVVTFDSNGNPVASPDSLLIDTQLSGTSSFTGSISAGVAVSGGSLQYVVADNNGSLYLQNLVNGNTQTLPGAVEIDFDNGVGIFDPTGSAEDVARLYDAALKRAPDQSGLEYWSTAIDSGNASVIDVANSFSSSPEFIQDYGHLADSAFVNQLYENVLGRPADASGSQYWDNALASGVSQGAVLVGFAESQEYQAQTQSTAGDENTAEAYRIYQAALDRTPDMTGLNYWATALTNGFTSTEMAQAFINSAEFKADYGSLIGSAFVTQLYQNVLHRAPDAAGLQYRTNALNAGSSEANVLVGFSDSLENRINTASATHANWVFIPA